MKRVLLYFFILVSFNLLSAVELKMIDKVMLTGGGEDDFIKMVSNFAVTEDGYYLVMDIKDADIKVFDLKGHFVKRIGRRGYGPMEFARPLASDYLDRQFIILDLDRRQFMLLSRTTDSFLKENKILRSIYMAADVALMNNEKILLCGSQPDNKGQVWSLVTYDLKKKQYDYLVEIDKMYAFDSVEEYKKNEEDIKVIGFSGYCDWWGDYAYMVWKGDIKIQKIDLKTNQIVKTFGKKTDFFHKPVVTPEFKKAFKELNLTEIGRIHRSFSIIYGLFTNKNYLLLPYSIPIAEGEQIQSQMLQVYTLEGEFLKEVQITHNNGARFYLSKDRDEDILYMMQMVYGNAEETEENVIITRFKLIK